VRFLVLHAHPNPQSFCAALYRRACEVLAANGHAVDGCDLYEEAFDPVMGLAERRAYEDEAAVRPELRAHVERLRAARGLVFVAPTWNFGMPAMMKGYLDRVWKPGVAFHIGEGRTHSLLGHVECLAAVTTYGAPRKLNQFVVGDPNRRVFMRGIGRLIGPHARRLWLAQYGMDTATEDERAAFLERVALDLSQLSGSARSE
jgi:putative NADPH-quinone reductase